MPSTAIQTQVIREKGGMRKLKISEGVKLLLLVAVGISAIVGAVDYFDVIDFIEQFNWY